MNSTAKALASLGRSPRSERQVAFTWGASSGADATRTPSRPRAAFALLAAALAALTYFVSASSSGVTQAAAADDPCPNAEFRTGPSANLPDCRAYELVSPPDTGVRRPVGFANLKTNNSSYTVVMPSPSLISQDSSHDRVLFYTFSGALPGFEGNGDTDPYIAARGADGWVTESFGPTAAETEHPGFDGVNPSDDNYLMSTDTFRALAPDRGSLNSPHPSEAPSDAGYHYLREADGSFSFVGQGSLGTDPTICPRHLSPTGDHVIFSTNKCAGAPGETVQLEPEAPSTPGTRAIYDRTPTGTHVVSLLPGDLTPTGGAFAPAVSADGSIVVFQAPGGGSEYYARVDNTETLPVTTGGTSEIVAGVSDDGGEIYMVGHTGPDPDLYLFDTASGTTQPVTTGGTLGSTQGAPAVVNVSADGSRIYFISPAQLDGPAGTLGARNLYVWNRASDETSFVATVSEADVTRADLNNGDAGASLTSWIRTGSSPNRPELNPGAYTSRTTPDGSVLVFESDASLTPSSTNGHRQIYRYDAAAATLTCVSCRPDGSASQGVSKLQRAGIGGLSGGSFKPLSYAEKTENVTNDGETVFFQSKDQLLARDHNDVSDVYRWKDGDLALISSGQSTRDSYFYAATHDGNDVLFVTDEHLVTQDRNSSGALYTARVNGGFPPADTGPEPCVGDECQNPPTPTPGDPGAGSSNPNGSGNQGKDRGSVGVSPKASKCAKKKGKKKRKKCRKKDRSRVLGGSK